MKSFANATQRHGGRVIKRPLGHEAIPHTKPFNAVIQEKVGTAIKRQLEYREALRQRARRERGTCTECGAWTRGRMLCDLCHAAAHGDPEPDGPGAGGVAVAERAA